MGPMASQVTSLTIVHSGADQTKTSKLLVTGLCAGNSPVTSEFPAQMASNTENVSIDDVIMGESARMSCFLTTLSTARVYTSLQINVSV